MPIGSSIPISASNNTVATVPEVFKLGDAVQLALVNEGDGFYALRGQILVGSTLRNIKDVNGEVIPGTGMQVKVRGYICLINGIIVGGQNKTQLNPNNTTSIDLGNISGMWYITTKAKSVLGSDGISRDDYNDGILSLDTSVPAIGSGKLLLAVLNIPSNTTQITSGMINNSVKKYLSNIDDVVLSIDNLKKNISNGINSLGNTINIAKLDFKLNTMLQMSSENLFKGLVDVFLDSSDIDLTLSTGYTISPILKELMVGASTSNGTAIWYKFDEGSGQVALDSANSNNGAITGGAYVPGILGTALSFDGASYIDIPASPTLDPTSGFSISFELKNFQSRAPYDSFIFNMGQYGVDNLIIAMRQDGQLLVSLGSGGGFQSISGQGYVNGNWNDIVLTYDPTLSSSHAKVYCNGQLSFAFDVPTALSMSSFNMTLGMTTNHSTAQGFVGDLDQFAYFTKALQPSDVSTLYNSSGAPLTNNVTSATVVSLSHSTNASPSSVTVTADGTNDIQYYASRDNGTTWMQCTLNASTSFTTQPTGQTMRYKVVLPAVTSKLSEIAVFWQ